MDLKKVQKWFRKNKFSFELLILPGLVLLMFVSIALILSYLYSRDDNLELERTKNLRHLNAEKSSDIQYKLFCASNRIEVGIRTIKELQGFRKGEVCLKEESTSLSAVMNDAQKYGGVSAECSCTKVYSYCIDGKIMITSDTIELVRGDNHSRTICMVGEEDIRRDDSKESTCSCQGR
jgi:hypothetical protein